MMESYHSGSDPYKSLTELYSGLGSWTNSNDTKCMSKYAVYNPLPVHDRPKYCVAFEHNFFAKGLKLKFDKLDQG